MSTQYWEEEIEIMSREKLQELQLQRLKKTINIAANSPYYKEVFSKNGITGDSIQSLDDIRKIPFTTKSDMRANYPFGLVAGDMKRDGVRIHSSSGTTGNPTVIVHSQHDLDSWANLVARCLYMVGIRKTDVFQNSSGYGMFTGGLGFQYGAERLGCLTVPAAAGNSKRQIKFISDFKTTALHAIPSYAIRLAEVFQEEGIDPRETTLKTLVIGAEPHTDEQRRKIERMLNVKAYNSFGMTEMNGPGVAFECKEQNGMHFWEDCYLVEIIDPETGEPVPEGEIGKAICEKYFPTENWERAYSLKTGIIKRISQYTGLNFREVLELPYSFYLLLNRESWIASYQSSEAGREILKNLWRLQQTEADEVAIHKFAEGRRKWQEA